MFTVKRIWVAVAIAMLGSPFTCLANRMISVDVGYVTTTRSNFGSGLVYGLGLTEGKGKVGFGITALRFSNTSGKKLYTVAPDGKIHMTEFDESVRNFYITLRADYRLNSPRGDNHMILGFGPQVHFVNSSLENASIKLTARDFRLGVGALFRYQRRIPMFGRVAFVLTAMYSHMQSVASRTDQYEPPTGSMNLATITAGFAFPF